jgi:hypothetical protein
MKPPPWIEGLARTGYVAKAVLYATIGTLAARAAISAGSAAGGAAGGATDTRGAMTTVLHAPFGRALLITMAAGLAGYAVWRIIEAIVDPEQRGSDIKGLALRASYLARGVVHAALAYTAVKLALGASSSSAGSGARNKEATATAFDLPGGEWLVWAAALGIGGYGLWQLYRAAVAKLSKELDAGEASSEAGAWVIVVSRFGIAARGIVFLAIGWLMARAVAQHDPERAGGIGDALRTLAELGRWPFAGIALGLIAYGGYQLVNARYRRIRAR